MFDDHGRPVKSAGPSTPVEVLGLQGAPEAGDQFQVADEAQARGTSSNSARANFAKRRWRASAGARITLDQLHEQLKAGEVKELAAGHQGGRAGLGRSAERNAAETFRRSRETENHSRQHRRGHGERRSARVRVGRDRRGVQRSARPQGFRSRAARRRGDSAALDHLRSVRRNQEGHDRDCSSPSSRKRIWAAPKCATPSASRAWA